MTSVEKTDAIEGLTKRLDAILRIYLEEQMKAGKMKRKDQLILLDSVGLSTAEIGRIFDIPSKDVSSALKKLKKGR